MAISRVSDSPRAHRLEAEMRSKCLGFESRVLRFPTLGRVDAGGEVPPRETVRERFSSAPQLLQPLNAGGVRGSTRIRGVSH